jgi:hypothetical protein
MRCCTPSIQSFRAAAASVAVLFCAIAPDRSTAQTGDLGGTQECQFGAEPEVLSVSGDPHVKGGQILQVWDVPNLPVFLTTRRPISGSYDGFLNRLHNSGVETDPVKLLERTPIPRERRNTTIVLQEARTWIGPINCLEMLLLGVQNERINIFEDPTEFVSFVLRSNDGKRLRIIFFSKNEYVLGNVSSILGQVAENHARGWAVVAALHNHNFHLREPELNGVVAPSAADAHLNRGLADRFQMEEAWITNGVSTGENPGTGLWPIPGRAVGLHFVDVEAAHTI